MTDKGIGTLISAACFACARTNHDNVVSAILTFTGTVVLLVTIDEIVKSNK